MGEVQRLPGALQASTFWHDLLSSDELLSFSKPVPYLEREDHSHICHLCLHNVFAAPTLCQVLSRTLTVQGTERLPLPELTSRSLASLPKANSEGHQCAGRGSPWRVCLQREA